MAGEKVLVTGASGFIAKHCIAELLRQGYAVQATLRDLNREEETRRAIGNAGATAGEVKFFPADLLQDEGWDAAVAGCTYVLHVASPFPIKNPKEADEVIRPAREGAVRVLKAAGKAGVKRVVLTSSVVAITLPWPEAQPGHVFDETDWTNPDRPDVTAYVVSKTLAERAAWEFVTKTPGAPELTVVNPAFVLGPAPDADLSTSHEVLRLMGTGAYLAAPKISFPVSDVRDVALTHVLAMTPRRSRSAVPLRQRLLAPLRGRPAPQASAARSRQEGTARRAARYWRCAPWRWSTAASRGAGRPRLPAPGDQRQGAVRVGADVPLAAGGGQLRCGQPTGLTSDLRALPPAEPGRCRRFVTGAPRCRALCYACAGATYG